MPNMVLFNIFINYLELIKFAGDIKVGETAEKVRHERNTKQASKIHRPVAQKGLL